MMLKIHVETQSSPASQEAHCVAHQHQSPPPSTHFLPSSLHFPPNTESATFRSPPPLKGPYQVLVDCINRVPTRRLGPKRKAQSCAGHWPRWRLSCPHRENQSAPVWKSNRS